MDRFVQTLPPPPDCYAGDHVLRATLDRLLGEPGHTAAAPALRALATEVAGPLRAAHLDAEAHPPQLTRYDGWGARVDRIDTSAGWDTQRRAAARHGLVALPYEQTARATWGAGARVVQLALLHLYGPESATFSCPVAMSDGAARLLCDDDVDPTVRDRWLPRLTSRDPDAAVTSGQWMTESTGGSDVGRTATTAHRCADGSWRLAGEKWFCSAVDSALAVVLARPDGAPAGGAGLACFLLPRYAEGGDSAPGIRVHRLKEKLGTRALPTAEVGLCEAYAWPLGDPDRPGLARMMRLAQVTRLHNAAAAAAGMRRGLELVRTHAGVRQAFGAPLDAQPLHRETLAWLAIDAEAAFALTAATFSLLGRVETDQDASAAALLRIAATLAKAGTARLAVASASEYVECFGGNGFIEDTGVPRLLRDAQVLPIWEGTTNVLALDVLRALGRDGTAAAYLAALDAAVEAAMPAGQRLRVVGDRLAAVRRGLAEQLTAVRQAPVDAAQAGARALCRQMSAALAAAALLEQAAFDAGRGRQRTTLVADLWIRRRLERDRCSGAGHQGFGRLVDGQE